MRYMTFYLFFLGDIQSFVLTFLSLLVKHYTYFSELIFDCDVIVIVL